MFVVQLSAPRHAYLWDHAVLGNVLMPAAGMLEIAHAAAASLLPPNSNNNSATSYPQNTLLLSSITIPKPFFLSDRSTTTGNSNSNSTCQLFCAVFPSSGTVSVQSGTNHTHLTATATHTASHSKPYNTTPRSAATHNTTLRSAATSVLAQIAAHALEAYTAVGMSGKAFAVIKSSYNAENSPAPSDMLDAALQLGACMQRRFSMNLYENGMLNIGWA